MSDLQAHVLFAPGGRVLGIDLGLALQVAAARGHDLDVLSELLPAAESGIRDAFDQPED